MEWEEIASILEEQIDWQKRRLLKEGRQVVPYVTPEDILQPNDYPALENNPHFRYEEGILAGMQAVQMALQARRRKEYTESDSKSGF